jgi:predicted XRE-type DNA-binding protein
MVKFEQFESVWDAIETDAMVAANLKARSSVMVALEQTAKSWRIKQVSAAKRLGVTQPRPNDLLHGRINTFSRDVLMTIAPGAGLSVEFKFKKAA